MRPFRSRGPDLNTVRLPPRDPTSESGPGHTREVVAHDGLRHLRRPCGTPEPASKLHNVVGAAADRAKTARPTHSDTSVRHTETSCSPRDTRSSESITSTSPSRLPRPTLRSRTPRHDPPPQNLSLTAACQQMQASVPHGHNSRQMRRLHIATRTRVHHCHSPLKISPNAEPSSSPSDKHPVPLDIQVGRTP